MNETSEPRSRTLKLGKCRQRLWITVKLCASSLNILRFRRRDGKRPRKNSSTHFSYEGIIQPVHSLAFSQRQLGLWFVGWFLSRQLSRLAGYVCRVCLENNEKRPRRKANYNLHNSLLSLATLRISGERISKRGREGMCSTGRIRHPTITRRTWSEMLEWNEINSIMRLEKCKNTPPFLPSDSCHNRQPFLLPPYIYCVVEERTCLFIPTNERQIQ